MVTQGFLRRINYQPSAPAIEPSWAKSENCSVFISLFRSCFRVHSNYIPNSKSGIYSPIAPYPSSNIVFFCKFEAPAKPVRTSAGAAISSFLWIYSLVFQQPLAKRSWGAVALVVQETASANSQSKTQSDFCEGLQAGKAISQLTPYLKKTAVHDSVSLIFTRGEFWKIQQQNQWTLGREIESRA